MDSRSVTTFTISWISAGSSHPTSTSNGTAMPGAATPGRKTSRSAADWHRTLKRCGMADTFTSLRRSR
eukprot:scaffold9015_cov96-Isochrysis_galbana.AAC.2